VTQCSHSERSEAKPKVVLRGNPTCVKRFSAALASFSIGLTLVGAISSATASAAMASTFHSTVAKRLAAVPHSTSSSFFPTNQNECQVEELAIAAGEGNGFAGTVRQPIIFTNDSSNTCWLKGYPSITLSNAWADVDNHAVHKKTEVFAEPKPQLVVLRPSEAASVGISYLDEQVGSSVCRTFRQVNIQWRADDFLWEVHIMNENYPCGVVFAVTPFEKCAIPKKS
jgi:hypothetical protein